MSSFVRASKYRHVFCDPPKIDQQFLNLRLSTVTGEQNYIKANPLYFAVSLTGGGGPVAIVPLDKPGKMRQDLPALTGHSAAVLDFDFNPFMDSMIATGSEDQTVKIWDIPEGGLTANVTEPLVDLQGHDRKVTLLQFHPTTANVLASVSGDYSVKLWDIEQGMEINTFRDTNEQLIQDIAWDYTGAEYALSCKDKCVRLVDARSATTTTCLEMVHEGAKSIKLTYLGSKDKFITVGFTRQSQRQFKVWDQRNTAEPLNKIEIDQASGVMMPFFDPDTSLLYLAGKGDGNIRFYEVINDVPYAYPLSDFRSNVSAKGMASVPKRGLNIMACETARFLKLTTNTVEPLSFHVPRKSESFQEDIYPDSAAGEPSQTAEEWLAGANNPPKLMSLNPSSKPAVVEKKKSFKVGRTPAVIQKELDEALARISVLEERLKSAGLSVE